MTMIRALQPDNTDINLPDLNNDIAASLDEALEKLENLTQATTDTRPIESVSTAYTLNKQHMQLERTPEPQAAPAEAVTTQQPSAEDFIGMRLAALQRDIKNHEEMVAQLRQHHASRGADLHAELDQHRREAKDRETELRREIEANQAELDASLKIHAMLLQSNHAAVEVLDPPPADVKMLGKVATGDRPKRKHTPRKPKAAPAPAV